MKKYCCHIFFVLFLFSPFLFAQKTKWTSNSAEEKVFIENKGQFDDKDGLSDSKILFAYIQNGFEIYFTPGGLTYRHDEIEQLSERQREKAEKKNKEEYIPKVTPHYVHMNWQGCTAHAQIIAEDKVSWYYTYPNEKDPSGNSSLKAFAYKKIIYKNIYPNIDAEYFFPEGKEGFKYSLILHPGADESVIKMNYSGDAKISKDAEGNIIVASVIGEIVDHAPFTYHRDGDHSVIFSFFKFSNNTVSFELLERDRSKTIVIDPWTTNPNYPTYNAAYDVEYDFAGNVYTYGGAPPYQVKKYNSSGAIQWVYTASLFTVAGYYGDFCVDGSSGSSYVFEAYRCCSQGTRIAKVNNAGTQLAMFAGNPQMQEFWRATFNNCTHMAIAVGSSFVNPTYFQACNVDTNMTSITASNVLNASSVSAGNDMCLLTLDNSNNCFMASCGNKFLKTPANTLTPTNYLLNDNYAFTELNSIAYVKNSIPSAIGMNGMAASNLYLYTYDGKKLQRFKKSTGALMNSAIVSLTSFRWGGIAVDECDHVFVGKHSSVVEYDSLFSVISTTPMAAPTDTVYDVRLAPGNLMYACGLGFVSAFQLSPSVCNFLTMSSTGSCSSTGSATVVVTGVNGPYTYSWSPSGQTTSTATGLPSGTYTVYVNDASCPPHTYIDSVVVTNTGSLSVTPTQTNLLCSTSTNGTATVTVTGGTSPYTYLWTPTGGTNATETGLAPGTYTVVVTDASGCSNAQTFTITSPPAIAITTTPTNALCTASNGSATSTVTGGTGPYTYSWNNSQTTVNATGLAAGTYTVYVTDANGCTQTQTATITSNNPLTLSSTTTQTSCTGNNGTATITPSNGTSPYTYSWNNSQTTQTATGLGAGTYTVTVTDANGCSQTQTVIVTSNNPMTLTATSTPATCTANNGTATANPANGTSPYTYSWSNSQTTQTATGLGAGTYTVTVTDANGCTQTQTVVVTAPVGPTATATASQTQINIGGNSQLTGTGGTTYSWYPSNGLSCTSCANPTATPTQTTTYCVQVTDVNGCTDVACVTINVDVPCVLGSLDDLLPNAFSPNGDAMNDTYCIPANACIRSFTMKVYDRWGEKVFETNDIKNCWDGIYSGQYLNTDVFAFYFDAVLTDGTIYSKKGNISLVR